MHLSELTHPNQLHGLSTAELQDVARQIRERHLEVVSTSGGHLGPGLGVVELTLALYQTLDLDHDRVVWDVGHQAYPHKLITGRYNDFHTLRQKDGVAGYLKRCESPFDHFGAGHASTSISAALGMALARDQRGEAFKCVAVIGDGSLTGGMALEAINHAGHLPKTRLLVVLNDNDMSISPPVGALSTHLNRMRHSKPLQFLQDNAEEAIKHLPFLHGELPTELKNLKESMKRLAVPKVGAVFEELGFTYMGPVDGHDIAGMVKVFQQAHEHEGPVLVHVATTKGKGYAYAEEDQVGYHAQSAFDLATGKVAKQLAGHAGAVNAVAFHANSAKIASARSIQPLTRVRCTCSRSQPRDWAESWPQPSRSSPVMSRYDRKLKWTNMKRLALIGP